MPLYGAEIVLPCCMPLDAPVRGRDAQNMSLLPKNFTRISILFLEKFCYTLKCKRTNIENYTI